MTLPYDALKRENEELRKRAETAEHELTVDLSYRERWQQARDENQELRAKLAGMKQEWRVDREILYSRTPEEWRTAEPIQCVSLKDAQDIAAGKTDALNLRRSRNITIAYRFTTEWKDADQEVTHG